jgi:cytochrome oxidase assembly protein ShyY1
MSTTITESTAEMLAARHTRRYRKVLGLICLIFAILISLGWWQAITRESFEDRMCDNQEFSLTALDKSLTAASRLVASNNTGGYDPVLREVFFNTYNEVHTGIIARRAALKSDYC